MEEHRIPLVDEDAVKDWVIQALILEAKDHAALQEIESRLNRVEKMLGLKLASRFPFYEEDP